jgi:PAS domain S-box-containing protein
MHMPRLDGLGLLAGMRQAQIQTVPVVLTGFGEVATAVEAMKLGAFDYLTKPPDYQELIRAMTRAIEHSRARRHGRIMEDLAAQWEITFDACPDLMAILDLQQRFLRCNRALAQRLGTDKTQIVGRPFHQVFGEATAQQTLIARTWTESSIQTTEIHSDRLGGAFIITLAPLRNQVGQIFGAVYVARDITERKQAEEARTQLLAREQAARRETDSLLQENVSSVLWLWSCLPPKTANAANSPYPFMTPSVKCCPWSNSSWRACVTKLRTGPRLLTI